MPVFPIKIGKAEWRVKSRMVPPKSERLGQTKKIISFSDPFPKILMRHLIFVVVIISVGSNAVAVYTGNNHACLWHKRFTDNDRDQQTYVSDRSGPEKFRKWPETDTILFLQCKNNQCGSKNTHAAVPEKLTINCFCLGRYDAFTKSFVYFPKKFLKI